MLYKELQAARRKFLPILIIFMLVALLNVTIFNPNNVQPNYDSIFHTWIYWLIFLSGGAAILGGSDAIAEENGKNTLSFLLTRPISRTTIYTTKLLVGAGYQAAITLITSLVMFLLEQMPQKYTYIISAPDGGTELNFLEPAKISTREALVSVAIILAFGWAILALTTLISIFSRSALQTIVIVILVAVGLTAVYALIDQRFNISYDIGRIFDVSYGLGLGDFFLLLAVAAGIYFAGLKVFKAKEF